MSASLITNVNLMSVKKAAPDIKAGYTVKVFQKIKEGEKERVQSFEGLVIKVNPGYGADKTITVRKIVSGVGVEKIFPLYSSTIEKIEIVKIAKVRRAKLWYMRDLSGKGARLTETYLKDNDDLEVDTASKLKKLSLKKVKIVETPVETVAVDNEPEVLPEVVEETDEASKKEISSVEADVAPSADEQIDNDESTQTKA